MATILTKRSNTASSVPLAADLTNSTSGAELAVNTADKRLFTKDSGGTVVELGTNPSSLTLTGGTANGLAFLNASKVLTTGSALKFDGSNLGLGVTPSGWGGSFKAMQLYTGASMFSTGISAGVGSNSYYDGTAWKYLTTGSASYSYQASGQHQWHTAPSGTAGNAITFTQAMTLDSSGRLLVGYTSSLGSSSAQLQVYDSRISVVHSNNGIIGGLRPISSTRNAIAIEADPDNVASSSDISFWVDGSEKARIDANGKLLVGTTSGSYKVEVAGDVNITGSYRVNGTAFSGLTGGQTGSAPLYGARAWVNFNGTGTVAIRASGNVSSITDNGTGDYTLNFTTAMNDANYSVSISAGNGSVGAFSSNAAYTSAPTSSAARIIVATVATTPVGIDAAYVYAAIFR